MFRCSGGMIQVREGISVYTATLAIGTVKGSACNSHVLNFSLVIIPVSTFNGSEIAM